MVYLTRTRDLHLAAIMTAHLSRTLIVAILRGSPSRWIAVSDHAPRAALSARRRHSLCFVASLPWILFLSTPVFEASDRERKLKKHVYFQRQKGNKNKRKGGPLQQDSRL